MTRRGARLAVLLLGSVPIAAVGGSLADGQAAYDSGRYQSAREIWRDLAEGGDAQAAFRLGALFERGDGVAANAAAAYCWYRVAAAGGVPAASFNVAVMHDSGRGAAQDAAAAAKWYARAAAFGFHRAEYNLGQLYEAGEGVPRNLELASAWYRRAASAGLDAAKERLARLTRSKPPDTQAVPRTVNLDSVDLASAQAGVPLTWAAVEQAVRATYYVEVATVGAPSGRPVFAAATDVSATLVKLPAGRYAARVSVAAVDASHYAVGPWTRFSVEPNAASAVCTAGD